ncbi:MULTISPECIES: zinc-binding dehydrogenase [unclassified Saccharopolyspora]|uniref:zinc-binding dehydrogenase n=1 Tax=unclassified Saccharopolyspora TaxID=2646250 RepID=UPI001CD6FB89|nr:MULTISPECIES: zinc-binding dehydrogenase [unclassified Saccharopolyspora]MCA1189868.1 zinc-binding dehydrogenase [Saccharopolyspora sp. 6T]MCA1195521.1 zinc-binding dehydrogenase [Saccharopolyspora sp. 6V]MCA1228277.1 zinc-binding dehydrogenase [Saccharopolyspora sp. 6M]MCA1282304.1 zinc-binding dehydrogenase [Saccharopolyspora sp. 7B]
MTVPSTMTAARLTGHGGPEALELADVPVPVPAEGEVLVQVGAVALNNTDLWTREGAYGRPGDPTARAGWRGPVDFPRIQGADVAGTVVDVGAAVDPGLRGTPVLLDPAIYDGDGEHANPVGLLGSERDGGYARYVTARADRAHDMSGSPLDDAELACFPTAYGTALGMLERGDVRDGHTVVVTGASGGVGLALVQLAAARGAEVLAISSAGKLDAVRAAGATEVLDRAEQPWDGVAVGRVDVVLDVAAGENIPRGLPAVRDGGRWVVAGALAGPLVELDVRRLYLHNIALVGSSMHTPAHFRQLAEIARSGRVRPVVAATYGLADVHRAQAELASRRHVGKLVLVG